MNDLELSPELKTGIAGMFGAVISMRFIKNLGPWQMIAVAAGGFFSAMYLTHMIIDMFQIPIDEKYVGGIGFLVGMFGQTLAGSILTAINNLDLLGGIKELAKEAIGKNSIPEILKSLKNLFGNKGDKT